MVNDIWQCSACLLSTPPRELIADINVCRFIPDGGPITRSPTRPWAHVPLAYLAGCALETQQDPLQRLLFASGDSCWMEGRSDSRNPRAWEYGRALSAFMLRIREQPASSDVKDQLNSSSVNPNQNRASSTFSVRDDS